MNGNKVVARLLDSHITATGDSEDAADYRVELDFGGISDEASNQQTRCVYDLLDLKTKRTNHLAALKGTNQDQRHSNLEMMGNLAINVNII